METTIFVSIRHLECAHCGVIYGLTNEFINEKLRSRGTESQYFYCPNGHKRYFGGESDSQKAERLEKEKQELEIRLNNDKRELEQRLAREKEDNKMFLSEIDKQRTKRLKLEKRIKNGVCPHCTRSFQNLKRHIACKHPQK